MARFYILDGVDYGRDLNAKISDNFYYGDFVSSERAVTSGIANVPNEDEWKNIEYLVLNILQPLRDKLGKPLKINSGFRCKELNDQISNDKSFHRHGAAADVDDYNGDVSLMDILEAAVELPFNEIIAEYFPNGWVHIGAIQGRTDQTIKLKDANNNYTRVTLDYIKQSYPNM